eukprot:TRINITY_DN12486_c0_g1_i3.p1 TRINITY_DN12486_c0_g1~~TRINITY_DN12486_c0_g1_i3.p1  ORF type:complete len:319 (+),score=93.84 TRINITY_DN12486_c0_g1_i3:113-1069(+)
MASDDEVDARLRARMEAFDGDDYSESGDEAEDEEEFEIDIEAESSDEDASDSGFATNLGDDNSHLSEEQRELIAFKERYDKANTSGFAALQQLQQSLGSKKFKLLRGRLKNALAHDTLYTLKPSSAGNGGKRTKPNHDGAKPAKQAKHAPEEQSSKRRPKALRQVVANTKKAGVDPRFQAYAGTYRPQAHDEAYRFLDETRETEFADVKRALRKHKQGAKHDELKRLLQSMKNKAVHRAQSRAKWEGEKKKRKLMQAQGLIDKEGKSKFHLKRSDQRKLEMLAKFESLKAKGQLKKAVKQRRKHNIQKERKALPDVRA